jgi:hypothetical protein
MKQRRRVQKQKWGPRAPHQNRRTVSCRVLSHVREALMKAASDRGWTVSAEAAQRLEASVALPDTPTAALMQTIAYAIDAMSWREKTWLTDPYLHQEAHNVIAAAFQLVQPKGYPPKPKYKPFFEDKRPWGAPSFIDSQGRMLSFLAPPSGRIGFEILWNEIRTFVPGRPPPRRKDGTRAKKSVERLRYERRLLAFREDLGPLLDKAVLWGKTGHQARRRSEALSVTDLKRFVELFEKRITDGLSEEELRQFVTLYHRYPDKKALERRDPANPGPFEKIALELRNLANPGPFGKIIPTADEESSS